MKDLPDVNVWVALSSPEHPHHARASVYWTREASRGINFCSVTAMGLLRVLSNPHTLQKNPLSVEQAWQMYLSWRKQPVVSYLREPGGYDALMARYLDQGLVNRRAWTDAHLAATAQAAKMRIVTFDSDFKRFRDLNILHLTD